jgi:hypothetical protein
MEQRLNTIKSEHTFEAITNPPTNIVFRVRDDEEILKLDANGDIYVRGELAENDKQVVDALREYLRGVGYLK